MKCDQAEQLIELHLSGEAEGSRLQALRQHAAACERCGASLAEAEQTARLLAGSMGALAAASPSPKPFIRNWVATSRLVVDATPRTASGRIISRPISLTRYGMISAMFLAPLMLMVTLAVLFRPAQQATKINYTLATLANLQVAIQAYQSDWGAYPPSGDDNLVRYLDGDPENGGPARTYFHFIPSQLSPDRTYLDPWGRPYHYRVWKEGTGGMNTRRFDLWSQGRLGNDPDKYITNWRDIPSPR